MTSRAHLPEPPIDLEHARAALAWAVRISQDGRGAVLEPMARPSNEAIRALEPTEIRGGMDALLLGKHPEDGLDAGLEIGLLDCWLPEVAGMVGFGDGEWRHKDVWKHTKQVVRQSVPRLPIRWGALLHDIGKPRTRKITANNQVTFHGHAEVGASMFRRQLSRRIPFEPELYERVHYLILHHLRASQYDGGWTDSAIRRFYKQMGDGLRDLLDLSRADITTKRPERKRRGLRQISDLSKRIREIESEDAKIPPLPKGLGNLLMTEFGLRPSRLLGEIRKGLEAEVEGGELEAGQDAPYYVAHVRANAARYGLPE